MRTVERSGGDVVRETGRNGVTATCLKQLRSLGCVVVKIHGSVFQPDAVDILGVAACGHAVAIETKAPGGEATPRQARFLAAWGKNGAIAGTVHSAEEATQLVRGHSCGLG